MCVGGGIAIDRLVGAAACCVCGMVSGGGGVGEWCGGSTAGGWGGRGWVLRWLGVWARVGKDGVYIRLTYIYAYCIARIQNQYASAGGPTDWRQTRVPQKMRLKTNKMRDFHVSAGCRHFACTKILTLDPRHSALK